MTQDEIDALVAAYHEAGHAIATLYSDHFELKDPAITVTDVGTDLARTHFKPKVVGNWDVLRAREFAIIGFGGYVAQTLFDTAYQCDTVKDGCDQDFEKIGEVLAQVGLQAEYHALAAECGQILHTHRTNLEALAQLIFKTNENISKATVEVFKR